MADINMISVRYNGRTIENGSYVEWLESLGAPVRSLANYLNIQVVERGDNTWFGLRSDDCTLAAYEYDNRTGKLVCVMPFVGDDEAENLSKEDFKARLVAFCEKYQLTPSFKYANDFNA